jgi:diguanylate cyclase (GGDEF)-like protein
LSFRSRLLLFFMIIVIVPMVAVALVLFSITADSETGKADASIAQGLRAALAVYDGDRQDARRELGRVASDPQLGRALGSADPAAARRRARQLLRRQAGLDQIAVYGSDRRLVAAVGSPTAVAPAVAAPSMRSRRLGLVAVSTTGGAEYVREVKRVTGLDARVARSDRVIASTLREQRGAEARSGNVKVAGADYRGRFAEVRDPIGPPLKVGVIEQRSALSSSIAKRRLLIGAILATFLLLALLSSIVVVRALQRQVNEFLEAARRLARGDFSRPVPVEGGDEFADLGREFNLMSRQLASKIDEVERKRSELEGSMRLVGDAIGAGLDAEEMVKLTVRTAVEACDAEAGRALPLDSRKMRGTHIGDDSRAVAAALEAAERNAFRIDTVDGDDWLAALEAGGGEEEEATIDQHRPARGHVDGHYALAVPLMARLGQGRSPEQVGVVSIARSDRDFDDHEYELFAYLTGQAAVSIENVDLHETVRVQAVTDELTGLANLRHFHETLDNEIERSRRFQTDVGLMLLDIDDFKAVNDTYGHQQGDMVLIEVARVLRGLSRDIDEPARYGGEEMAVILPQTDVEGAEFLAERMRMAVESIEIERLDGEGTLSVTASFGVAALPYCATDKASLIAEADAALYRSKRAGKNRVAKGEPVTAES